MSVLNVFLTNYVRVSPCPVLIYLWTGLSSAQQSFYWLPISLPSTRLAILLWNRFWRTLHCIARYERSVLVSRRKQLTEECTRRDAAVRGGEELQNRDPLQFPTPVTIGHKTIHTRYLSVSLGGPSGYCFSGSFTEDLQRLLPQCPQGCVPIEEPGIF